MHQRQNGPSDRPIAVLTQSICRSGNKKRQLGHRVLDPYTAVHRLPMHAACLASAKTRRCLDMTHCRRCKKMLYSERYKPADNEPVCATGGAIDGGVQRPGVRLAAPAPDPLSYKCS